MCFPDGGEKRPIYRSLWGCYSETRQKCQRQCASEVIGGKSSLRGKKKDPCTRLPAESPNQNENPRHVVFRARERTRARARARARPLRFQARHFSTLPHAEDHGGRGTKFIGHYTIGGKASLRGKKKDPCTSTCTCTCTCTCTVRCIRLPAGSPNQNENPRHVVFRARERILISAAVLFLSIALS